MLHLPQERKIKFDATLIMKSLILLTIILTTIFVAVIIAAKDHLKQKNNDNDKVYDSTYFTDEITAPTASPDAAEMPPQ